MTSAAHSLSLGAGFVVLASVLGLVAFSEPAAAHDPNCVAATHAGPVKQHALCDGTDHEEICVLSLNVMFVHFDVAC